MDGNRFRFPCGYNQTTGRATSALRGGGSSRTPVGLGMAEKSLKNNEGPKKCKFSYLRKGRGPGCLATGKPKVLLVKGFFAHST